MSPTTEQDDDIGALLTTSYQKSARLGAQLAQAEDRVSSLEDQYAQENAYRNQLLKQHADNARKALAGTRAPRGIDYPGDSSNLVTMDLERHKYPEPTDDAKAVNDTAALRTPDWRATITREFRDAQNELIQDCHDWLHLHHQGT